MAIASKRLASIVDELVERHDGHRPREQGEGDNFVAIFRAGGPAAAFSLSLAAALADEPWPEPVEIRMRLGMHTGDIQWDERTGYLGPTFNRCARIRDLGHGGMILMSQATRDILTDGVADGWTIDDLGEQQLRDLSRIEHVFLLRAEGDVTAHPPLKSITAMPNNLPVPVTSLIGREEEISAVARLLIDKRLVTLTGAGGSGKTRLAQHVASEVLGFATGGAWWIDLMPVSDDDRVPTAVGEALGIHDIAGGSHGALSVAAAIGDAQMLLILDNCEHLIDAVADTVSMLLERCSHLRVLATSRETLDVDGEHPVRVRPLAVPTGAAPSSDELMQLAATRLFLERAATLDTATLDPEACRSIAAICRRLDGMPLAIELAAARTRLLDVTQIEAGLDDRFSLLTATRRGRRSGSRQRTLEASIAWSYDLLDDEEKAMLCRLGVFPATFDLEGAQSVGADRGPGGLDLLTALVDKSLVTVRPATDGRRYRLLESIRHYALERLQEMGEAAAARDAHLDYTMGRIRHLSTGRVTWDEGVGEILDLDAALIEDVRAAAEWAHQSGRVLDVVDLFWPWSFTGIMRGTYHDAINALVPILDHPDLDVKRRARAHAIAVSALASANQIAEALALSDRAIELARSYAAETGHESVLCFALAGVALVRAWAGESGSAVAREVLEASRRNRPVIGDGATANTAPFAVLALAFDGYEDEAYDAAVEGLAAARSLGWRHVGALSANLVLSCATRLGLPMPVIRDLQQQALDAIPSNTPRLHASLAAIGGVWGAAGADDPAEIERWVQHGFEHAGPPGTMTHGVMVAAEAAAAWLTRDLGRLDRAAGAAARMFEHSSNRWYRCYAAWLRAEAAVLRSDPNALRLARETRALVPDGRFPLMRANAATTEARALLAVDPEAALPPALEGVEISHTTRAVGNIEFRLTTLARALCARRRFAEAAHALGVADRMVRDRESRNLFASDAASVTEQCRRELGDEAFAKARSDGERMSLDDFMAATSGATTGRTDRPPTGWGALTDSEADVARKVAQGMSNQQVADALFVSLNTVKTHLKSVYAKLQVSNRAALAALVAGGSDTSHPS